MLAGLQGAGKTTLAGKLAKWLKDQNQTPILVAADLQRPNAVTQLQVLGEKVGVPVFSPEPGNGVGDPVDVAKKAIAHAKKSQFSVVIVDTAGRLHTQDNLMRELTKIRNVLARKIPGAPHEVLLVLDATSGQNAVQQARLFGAAEALRQATGWVLWSCDRPDYDRCVAVAREALAARRRAP